MKVSIVIPVYNAEKYIQQCFNCLINQTDKNFEVICVDDGSTDGSLKKLNSYAQKDSRFKIFSKPNGGAGSARNLGIRYSSGEYTLFLDIDDYLEFDAIEKLYMIAKQNNSDFLFYNFITENENKEILKKHDFANYTSLPKKELIKLLFLCKLPFGPHQFIKTSLIKDNGFLYSEEIKVNEELVFKLRLLDYAERIMFTDYTPYHYIKHPVSLSKTFDLDRIKDRDIIISEVADVLHKNILNDNEYKILINTYNVSRSIIFSYQLCKSKTYNFWIAYAYIKGMLSESLYEKLSLIEVEENLFTGNIKFLYKILKYKCYFTYVCLCRIYAFVDKHKISRKGQ